ncbi:selenocysteine lyase [Aequorivita sublithincola DSM 14238]|uniref:Selenocysteine lyase n=1 Tax=Aequorivita sublithincola (strain DSM 14238 / LMG 21431 / ACAM 643 / 9-3) TaxID=746697 RepID=I3YVE9_AEQSU|nr:aminotransferase class V-fold PLP-dependent enzyme [Aequorivita sublithincola]AFL80967.1 selenocysteine lyase [Aequorivita sublithincola DSM 14238]
MISSEEKTKTTALEKYFEPFRNNIVGINQEFDSPFGRKKIIYTDWTASGRLYAPIEEKLLKDFGPFVANTHTETSVTGTAMTKAYHEARKIIKKHVNAGENDVLITCDTGMTGAINKFQRILGLKIPESIKPYTKIPDEMRPVVFVTHMEHHSNQTTWLETIAEVVVVPPDEDVLVCMKKFAKTVEKYKDHPIKIASVTACSNVTGIQAPYREIAKLMHKYGGLCFVDFACSAPYVSIDMHPEEEGAHLDAVLFSPHKFLGGPGSSGVLIFNNNLYKNSIPDNPGGGTVSWTNPWGNHKYIDDIESREDGGTPGFLQTIRTALSIRLKEKMGIENILDREHELLEIVFEELNDVPNLKILAPQMQERLAVVSFYIDDLHFNLGVKLLNDRFGIQTRGGCSCAGTYGHYLLHVDLETSTTITCEIDGGDLTHKPGWIRMSFNPTSTNAEVQYVCDAIKQLAENFPLWAKEYSHNSKSNEFSHKNEVVDNKMVEWFTFE